MPAREPQRFRTPLPEAESSFTVDQDVIKIVDLNPGSNSVTNDAERVLRKIEGWQPGLIVRCRIMYRDSLAIWDGMRFFPIREKGMERRQSASSDRLTDLPVVDKYAQKRQRVSLEPARNPGLNLFAGTCKTPIKENGRPAADRLAPK